MCAVRLVCLRHADAGQDGAVAEAVPSLREMNVRRVYGSRDSRVTAEALGARLGVPVETEGGIGAVEGAAGDVTTALGAWLTAGDLDARVPGGESGAEVLARFAAATREIADRHRGETVAVVSHAATLSLGLPSLCTGLRPLDVWGRPPQRCRPVIVEYDGEAWRCQSGWPAEPAG